MGDLTYTQAAQPVTIVDEITGESASIIKEDGVNKLRAKADVTVNSLRAFDPVADWWGWIGSSATDTDGVGGAGDVITWAAAAGDDPTLFPAISVDTTVQAGDDEDDLVDRIVTNLNNDSGFNTYYRARKIYSFGPTLFVESKLPGAAFQRPNPNDISFTATGTTTVTPSFTDLAQRQKQTIGAKDPSNPTLCVLSAAGSLQVTEGDVSGRLVEFAENGGSNDLRVDGSVTPVDFQILPSATKERFFTSLRFEALANGIQFTNFLKNPALTNGILVTIRSNNSEVTFPAIKTTEDFASFWSRGASDFNFYDVAGTDYFRSTLSFTAPFQLYKTGTFATDDFIRVRISDDISSGLTEFRFIGFGFERDF